MNKGFIQIRRGLEEHLENGTLGLFDLGIYLMIHLQANYETGVWWGSAAKLAATAPRDADARAIRRSIENLEQVGFIKRFHKQGKRGNYPVLLNKYQPQSGALTGKRLNAALSTDWRTPVYESCREDAVRTPSDRREDAPILKEERKETKKNPAAKPAPPDPRHKPFFDFAYEAFRKKHLQPPTWGAKHANGLRLFLAGHPQVNAEEWQRRYLNFLASTDPFYQQQKGSLLYFAGNFDRFIDGPILERKSTNGKPDTNEAVAITMQGAAINARRPN